MNTHSSTVSLTDNQQAAQAGNLRGTPRVLASNSFPLVRHHDGICRFCPVRPCRRYYLWRCLFPESALLSSFAAYSVGFIARPIGALLFGWIGEIVMVITID